ncbi:MAG TPA: Gfo/Idh/MocA family oxidoreductase [Candidatus Sumerlaeota bacterium]|nr:Gfo/Idh/MocA family oxidoreductase [Candidatus Sumerlaeota bacterium]HOR29315.1 Gfo/Idh/MocA family oxidoreductase [Candidatus Sumerlaeota bacterium]HPK01550.1 Gfo/Idh/MocA family oxidoreductase [Candidatus Sumerlaeota bacterium]
MAKKVRVAFIGAGELANIVHYPSLASFKDVEIVALCDLSEERRNATAAKFNVARTFSDYRQMLQSVKVDAVYVILPPQLLHEPVVYCLKAGLHVFTDKPPGVTPHQTRAWAGLAARHKNLTMVGFQRRYAPIMRKAREQVIKRGGAIQHAVAQYYKGYKGGLYYEGAIDILTCDAIHAVDALRWVAGGEVVDVTSDLRDQVGRGFHDLFTATVRFSNGCLGFLFGNWNCGAYRFAVEMHANRTSAFVEINKRALYHEDGNQEGEVWETRDVAGSDDMLDYAGFRAENRHFIDCIKSGRQPDSHFGDAAKSMELVEKIHRAARPEPSSVPAPPPQKASGAGRSRPRRAKSR